MKTDTAVIPLRQPDSFDDPLTEVAREGARRMLAAALQSEADAFVSQFSDEQLADGRKRIVRHGQGPQRTIQTGIGALDVRRPKVRDRAAVPEAEKIRFTSAILPRWARRSKSLDALLPVLYLRGISTGDFQEALGALLGADAPNLSPGVISRLTGEWQQEYDRWQHRDLSARRYVYVWADGVCLQARMEPQAECILVIIGATPEGKKELVGFQVGVRESAQSPLSGFAGKPLSVNGTRTAGGHQGTGACDPAGDRRGPLSSNASIRLPGSGWCHGVLEGHRRNLPQHTPPAMLGSQGCRCAQQVPQVDAVRR